jgi:hypothetical protein
VEAEDAIPIFRTAISQAAYEAILATLSLGSVAFEPEVDAKGQRQIRTGATEGSGPVEPGDGSG